MTHPHIRAHTKLVDTRRQVKGNRRQHLNGLEERTDVRIDTRRWRKTPQDERERNRRERCKEMAMDRWRDLNKPERKAQTDDGETGEKSFEGEPRFAVKGSCLP